MAAIIGGACASPTLSSYGEVGPCVDAAVLVPSDAAVLDASVADAAVADAAVRVCDTCEADDGCGQDRRCRDPGTSRSYCTNPIAKCIGGPAPLAAVVDFVVYAGMCPQLAQCTFRGTFVPGSGEMSVSLAAETDMGQSETDLGRIQDPRFPSLWEAVQPWCVSNEAFRSQIGCFTHSGLIRATFEAPDASVQFEYVPRASIEPAPDLTSAIELAVELMVLRGRDAGLVRW
jgi:hypothetical protein